MKSNNLKHNKNLRLFLNTNKEKVKKKNRFLRFKEEQEKTLQNKLKNLSIRPAIKGDDGQIDKRILPFFSVAVILKKISDKKKYKNLSLLNPQKKLIYKIIKLNKKLEKLVESIKKYNLNLNSFKGSKLDFILFLRNNLYFNLKIRFSNILYKINLIKAVYNSSINNNNSINNNSINNNNSIKLSPLEKLEKLIAEAGKQKKNKKNFKNKYRKVYKNFIKINKNTDENDFAKNLNSLKKVFLNMKNKQLISKKKKPASFGLPLFKNKKKIRILQLVQKQKNGIVNLRKKTFLENIVTILNNYSTLMKYRNLIPSSSVYKSGVGIKNINNLYIFNDKRLLNPQSILKTAKTFAKIKKSFAAHYLKNKEKQNLSKAGEGLEFKNAIQLLCKSKESEIKYLLFNLNNLIKKIEYIINIININETLLKKINIINSSAIYSIKNEINNNINTNINKQNFPLELENNITHSHNSTSNKNSYFANGSYGESLILSDNYNKTDLYLQISNGLNNENADKALPENIIKIEKTIKTITNHDNMYYNDYNSNFNYNNNYPSLKDKGILTKNFD